MTKCKVQLLVFFLTLGAFASATAQTTSGAGVPYPQAGSPMASDLGDLAAQPNAAPISITVVLPLRDLAGAESLLHSLHTPGDPQFGQFLTAQDFVSRFAPTAARVASVAAVLAGYGLATQQTTATTLNVSGPPAAIERAFSVSLHQYAVPARGNAPGYTYHAPSTRPTIPAAASASILAIAGLDTRPSFRPRHDVAPASLRSQQIAHPASSQGNAPGFLTVKDFANLYNVQPLYKQGVSGSGRTIGIMSLAAFTPSDAFAYWKAVGLTVKSNRIQIVNVDGGPGAPSDASGSDETTLDVEQSGGIAPGANILVYLAPNSNQGFVDVFAAAIDANKADTLSISWGGWEWFNNLDNAPVSNPSGGGPPVVSTIQAIHQLLVRAAIQGQTVFAASGDSGAYDANDIGCFPTTSPSCNEPLSVDYPASDPAITAAGGTTLPGIQQFCLNDSCTSTFSLNIAHEQAWGWDYLQPLCNKLGVSDPITCGIFPVGTGGGVSVFFPRPLYQLFLSGIQNSQPNQTFVYDGQLLFTLPSNYPGRNVPDISFNADPDTGYVVYYTSDVSGFAVDTFFGGTSFVAPQLNGVSALLGQYLGGRRVGLLNYPLYLLALTGSAYSGPRPPLHAITLGDNWFYHGRNGYSPTVGLGTLDVANFAAILQNPLSGF
jgi:kumamolisin